MAEIAIRTATNVGVNALEKLFQHVSSTVKSEISLVLSLHENINFLKERLPVVKDLMLNAQAVIVHEEISSETESRVLSNSKLLVKGFKQFVYDGEDIVDEFDIRVGSGRINLIRKWKIARKMKKLYAELEELKEKKQNADDFLKVLNDNLRIFPADNSLPPLRKTSMNMIERADFHMVGRDEEKKSLLEDLLRSSDSKPSVVLLTGMGGIGKTTFAHDILKDPEIDRHFEFKKWVTVGDRNLDPKKVLNQLNESDERTNDNLRKASDEVGSALMKKRFLIVLDDVWDAKDLKHKWNELWVPLSYGGEGSRVIVTTREQTVSCRMEGLPVKVKRLGLLTDEQCLEIFEGFAFLDGCDIPSSSSASSWPPPPPTLLKEMGKQIVKEKVKGVPLAARVIGSSLRGKGISCWKVALLQIRASDINSAILWSYLNLPMQVRQCFALCSIIPKDAELAKTELVRLWMAHSFVVQSNTNSNLTLVEIGERNLDHLVNASLIEVVEVWDYRLQKPTKDVKYKMHDLIHDFALNILGDEFSGGKDIMIADPNALRHLVIAKGQEMPKNHSHIKKLYTFVTGYPCHVSKLSGYQLKTVRFLSIRLDDIPRTGISVTRLLEKLCHIRYLDISKIGTPVFDDGSRLCSMYALQTLILPDQTIQFPKDMSKRLVNLHHIEAGDNVSRISELGQLTKLHSIGGRFILHEDNWQSIEELRNLTQLRGRLKIIGLGHVQYSQLLREEQLLNNHRHLEELVFDMSRGTKQLLEYLQPHINLKALTIQNGKMDQFPTWLGNKDLKLLSLELFDCSVKRLPPLRHLPLLQSLIMTKLHELQHIDQELTAVSGNTNAIICCFPSLKYLRVEDCSQLKELPPFSSLEVLHVEKTALTFLPQELPDSLQKFYIRSCENLQALPNKLPSSLEHLEISSCENLQTLPKELPSLLKQLRINFCSNLHALPKELPSSLKQLRLNSCSNLHVLPKELPSSLKQLWIHSCSNLQALPNEPPSSLEQLEISSCENLQVLPKELPSSLKQLSINSCSNLQALPKEFPSSLEQLSILSCTNLQALPKELPSSLKQLWIHSFSNLHALQNELPSSLEQLEISSCENLQVLPKELPSSLKQLRINSCSNLQVLPKELPSPLKQLSIHSFNNLQALPKELPSSLEQLWVSSCDNLHALSKELPSSLKYLRIDSCSNLQALPKELPSALEQLWISSCDHLKALPKELPSSLKYLRIDSCSNLRALPKELPSSLEYLYIESCSNLQALPKELPSSLKYLRIDSCNNLQALPKELPSSLKYLRIDSCSNFQVLPKELPSSLEYLYIKSCSNLQAFPKQLPSSLEQLSILSCSNLQALPKELPSRLRLFIADCPLLDYPQSKED